MAQTVKNPSATRDPFVNGRHFWDHRIRAGKGLKRLSLLTLTSWWQSISFLFTFPKVKVYHLSFYRWGKWSNSLLCFISWLPPFSVGLALVEVTGSRILSVIATNSRGNCFYQFPQNCVCTVWLGDVSVSISTFPVPSRGYVSSENDPINKWWSCNSSLKFSLILCSVHFTITGSILSRLQENNGYLVSLLIFLKLLLEYFVSY